MKASDLSETELLLFKHDNGKIFWHGRRTLILGADALGTLRKDLISVMGLERAKGFLLRYGWNWGTNDARYTKEMNEWDDDYEWLITGPKIHGISGQVQVLLKDIKADKKTGEFYCEGYWYNSYEAEQHIKHFGYHHDPVCLTLIGYAGGFCSECMGKRIIYKEIECVGKGDPYCRFIGKAIDDWEDGIESEISYYKEENLANELDKAYHRIEQQKEDLNNALTISEKLSTVLANGKGLTTIVKILSEQLHTTVVLEDKNFNLMESFGEYKPHDLLNFIHSKNRKHIKNVDRLMIEKKTVHLLVSDNLGVNFERLITPIIIKNEVCGYLSLIKPQYELFNEMEILSLERASTICAIQFQNDRTLIETEQHIKGDLLNELLLENPNIRNISYRMKLMGYDLNKPYYVFVFCLQDSESVPLQQLEPYFIEVREKLADTINGRFNTNGENFLVTNKLDKIVTLIPEKIINHLELDLKAFGKLLVNLIGNSFGGYKVNLGISNLCKDINGFKRGYEEALKSIEILIPRGGKSNVITFNELGSLGILFNSKNSEELKSFAYNLLVDVITYDQENNTELLKTLYIYLENQGNIQETAREMMLSIGAIRYRLKRFHEITKLDLTHSKVFFDTHLALQILIFYEMVSFQ